MSLYSIWVLEYSFVPGYARSMVIYGAHNQGIMRLPYCYVVIKGPDNLVMVDVGYNHRAWGKEMAERLGVKGWRSPRQVLAKIGFTPEQVDTVLTHPSLHFDHARKSSTNFPMHASLFRSARSRGTFGRCLYRRVWLSFLSVSTLETCSNASSSAGRAR